MGNEGGKGKKAEDQLFDAAFEMRQQAKMLEKEAQRVFQQEQREKAKVAQVNCSYNLDNYLHSIRILINGQN